MLEILIMIGGVLHLGTLLASAQVPKELRFKEELPKINNLMQHWVLTAGGYIVLNIVAFGILSLTLAEELTSGSVLARAICGFISVFWGIRLVIQLFWFDAEPYLRNLFLRVGFHALTIVFAYHTLVYGWAAAY
ncbi:MAG: hypothetical protein AAF483_02335 [Planctomycetota bacterium]